jgi:hypothetical protein
MRTQEQALRMYYASMSEAELLEAAKNQISFILPAQKLLTEELVRRHLPTVDKEPLRHAGSEAELGLMKLAGKLRHAFHH